MVLIIVFFFSFLIIIEATYYNIIRYIDNILLYTNTSLLCIMSGVFEHSIKVPRLYKTASKILKTVREDGVSLKQLVYLKQHPVSKKKKLRR